MPNEATQKVQQIVADNLPGMDNALKEEAIELLKSLRVVLESGVEKAGAAAPEFIKHWSRYQSLHILGNAFVAFILFCICVYLFKYFKKLSSQAPSESESKGGFCMCSVIVGIIGIALLAFTVSDVFYAARIYAFPEVFFIREIIGLESHQKQ